MSEADRFLLTGARVRTLDPALPRADWILVRGERIEATGVGTPPAAPRSVDLGGAHVIPGLVDAHTHLEHWGENAARLDLGETASLSDALDRVRDRIVEEGREARRRGGRAAGGAGGDDGADGAADPAGLLPVLIAERWDETRWGSPAIPTRAALDRIAPDRPVVLRRVCCHLAVANTEALRRIGSGWEGVDPETGVLLEGACLALGRIFPPSFEQVLAAARFGAWDAARHGIVAVQEMVSPESLRAFLLLDARGELPLDVTFHTPERLREEAFRLAVPSGFRKGRLRRGGIKLFLDGSLGARSAALSADYADLPGARGLLLFTPPGLAAIVRSAETAGLQLAMHAIGDLAIDLALRALEEGGAPGANPLRHRIEHFEVLDGPLLERAARRGVIASVQPNFIGTWSGEGGLYASRLGPARFAWNNPFREIHAAGIPLAFGSDTMPLSTAFGLGSAHGAPLPRQRLDGDAILAAHTRGAAYAGWDEAERGAVRPGMLADLAVFSRDPAEPGSFPGAAVLLTVARGRRTHLAADGWPGGGAPAGLDAIPVQGGATAEAPATG
jgi:predicted amidohydrolase YtcJ